MEPAAGRKDLVVLAADKDMEMALQGIFSRRESLSALGIRSFTYEIYRHPEHDPGCYKSSHEILRSSHQLFDHALVLFDYEGCGQEGNKDISEIAEEVEKLLNRNGWGERAKAIIIDPELEVWLWVSSPHVADELGWKNGWDSLRTWLRDNEIWDDGAPKPLRPKEAVEKVLDYTGESKSSSIHQKIAQKVSFNNCSQSSFTLFLDILKEWFPM